MSENDPSPFRKGPSGGPGSTEGEPEAPPRPALVYAFHDKPVLIIWLSQRGEKLREQLVHYQEVRE